MNVEAKMKKLGIELPTAPTPKGNYIGAKWAGNIAFSCGQGPFVSTKRGLVGKDLTLEEGYQAAKVVGINQLAVLKKELGNLNKVKRIVKVKGMINAAPDFTEHSKVINGYSDLMVAVFGERGKHARAAVGMGSLPKNIAVEIEMIVEVFPD